jgi:hypothetical protein
MYLELEVELIKTAAVLKIKSFAEISHIHVRRMRSRQKKMK